MTADIDIQLNSTDVAKAHSIIISVVHKTQILTSTSVNSLTIPRLSIFFKAEVFQKTGAFKYRGASHALSCLPPSSLVNGVVTHSSGNHGAALSLAAQERGVKCHVVMVSPITRIVADSSPRTQVERKLRPRKVTVPKFPLSRILHKEQKWLRKSPGN
jgi:threonine dehydratase